MRAPDKQDLQICRTFSTRAIGSVGVRRCSGEDARARILRSDGTSHWACSVQGGNLRGDVLSQYYDDGEAN